MQYFRQSFRYLSTFIVDTKLPTRSKELNQIKKLMKTYNDSNKHIRTLALFEWMLNITNIEPDFECYLSIIRACEQINNMNMYEKIYESIENDRLMNRNEYDQLQIKLIYIFSKIKNISLAEKIFYKLKSMKNSSINSSLFGTMLKGYNMNGQQEKTIQLYIDEILNKNSIALDPITATCVLNACSDRQRLDIGERVHSEVRKLKFLDSSNIRLTTAIMDMYCKCGVIDRAQELFNQAVSFVDCVAYSTLMKGYLSNNQPVKVLSLYKQSQSSSSPPIKSDSILYLNVIEACYRLGLMKQAEFIHRSIPSDVIEKSLAVHIALIDMHANSLHLNEAHRLFNLIKNKDNISLGKLLHGYAIHGQGHRSLKLFNNYEKKLKFTENSYKIILKACAFTGGLVDEAKHIYKTIPNKYKTVDVASIMVSILARASLFDEAQLLIHQYKSMSENVLPLLSALFMVCYHSGNKSYIEQMINDISRDPILLLLYSDMNNLKLSNEIIDYFQQQPPEICWTEIKDDNQNCYTVYEYTDNDLHLCSSLSSELENIVDDLKSVNVNWENKDNDLKKLFCGHTATRLAIAQNFMSTLPGITFQITKTKPLCHVCHEGIKQLSLLRQRDIILKDNIRVHHFHNGHCSCCDQF